MQTTMQRSAFLGTSLKAAGGQAASGQQAPKQFQCQAFFKKAQKEAGSVQKTAQKKAAQAPKKAQQPAKKATQILKKALPSAPKTQAKSAVKQAKKAAPKPPSPRPLARAAKGGSKRTKGWLGEAAGGAQNLDKWYGELDRTIAGPSKCNLHDSWIDHPQYALQAPTVPCSCPLVCWTPTPMCPTT